MLGATDENVQILLICIRRKEKRLGEGGEETYCECIIRNKNDEATQGKATPMLEEKDEYTVRLFQVRTRRKGRRLGRERGKTFRGCIIHNKDDEATMIW
jgi:hypothetical protein